MLGKGSRPLIGKLQEPLNPTKITGFFSDVVMSPKSPLDFKIRSPRGLKNCELGAVGLAIVVALEKSGTGNDEIPAKYVVGSLNLNRSDPIPVNDSAKTSTKSRGGLERSDSFACMNSRKVDKSDYTILYCDGNEEFTSGFDRRSRKLSFFCESPPRISRAIPAFQTSDFLSSCHLCRKKLHGKDIYMYRGEKAFCSTECRYRQIVIDEHKEKCRSEASRPVDISGLPYNNGGGQIFSTGIIAA